ncbi:MAG: L(+)-tartrate dehydratase subunit beta [Spirochaetaceae bacterium]|jgi:L(+)-tartrate dehydratase beta subunit|nr:L(+)-tartrate dehydratase subunit beta [Spirochaetaceae bacterium]
MNTWHLSTPLGEGDTAKLNTGDLVYLSGTLVTGRDEVHHRVVRGKLVSPVDLAGKAIFHAGPIMRQDQSGLYRVISIGPTTSMRMEQCEAEFLRATGVRLMVGKGGMGGKTAEACRSLGAVHTVFPGGCAVLAADKVEAVEGVAWLDLGMPEAMWIMRVRNFGPLIVSIDVRGNNLFEDRRRLFTRRKEEALKELETFTG